MESVDRLEIPAVRQSGKADDAHVDTDVAAGMHRCFLLVFGLDGDVPLVAFGGHGYVLDCADDGSTVSVAHPADFRQVNTVVSSV